ncbi:CPBP family intramembrane glutamic endopeptidase [Hyalangium rubrum]|uniref:CPBP family intramembrane glutamic endopeptidase n=1 Tax=Hyalangium rubrum TaxID=3103134 RepID=A0ABU5HGT2_9BACT|nr:CPBP family intramembrane glutamic endopeptidase [Hyalangium sp. s54d21]MDY7232079.1 CPBP family intramembrane glutamic endopeptidase [Hyalangium sp. s54d21]
MSERPTHLPWLLAASLAAAVWAVLVHLNPSGSWALQKVFCAGWLALAWKALGPGERLRVRPTLREVLLGVGVGVGMVAISAGLTWSVCVGSELALCAPAKTLAARAAEVQVGSMVGIGLIIVPAEELFWHGAVHGALRPRVGRAGSAALSTALLSLSYLGVGEWELALVVLPTFLVWGLLTEWRRNLVSACVSHALWTLSMIPLMARAFG